MSVQMLHIPRAILLALQTLNYQNIFPSFPAVLPALYKEAVVKVKLMCTVRAHGCMCHMRVRSAGAAGRAGDFPLLEEG